MSKEKFKRRDFISLVSKTTILGLGASPLISLASNRKKDEQLSADEHIFLTEPYLQNPDFNGITIMWITAKDSYSWVEFQSDNGILNKAQAVTDGLVDANNQVHKIHLENLEPGTKYTYTVFSKEITEYQPYKISYGTTISSSKKEFTTPALNAEDISLIIMNDIHDRPKSIVHLMELNGKEPFDFVFFNGDMFDFQKDQQQIIQNMLIPCTSTFASSKPFMFVRGNHETRGKFARQLPSYFNNINDAQYFSFTRGPVHFIALDTGEDKEDAHPVYAGLVDFDAYRRKQALWLEQQLKSNAYKKAKFKVILMHIPHYHSGEWHGPLHCREVFGSLFNKYKIDLMICGHTHTYGIHEAQEGHNFPIVIGGGPQEGKRTLIRLKANVRSLNLSMIRDDGKEVGTYQIKR